MLKRKTAKVPPCVVCERESGCDIWDLDFCNACAVQWFADPGFSIPDMDAIEPPEARWAEYRKQVRAWVQRKRRAVA